MRSERTLKMTDEVKYRMSCVSVLLGTVLVLAAVWMAYR